MCTGTYVLNTSLVINYKPFTSHVQMLQALGASPYIPKCPAHCYRPKQKWCSSNHSHTNCCLARMSTALAEGQVTERAEGAAAAAAMLEAVNHVVDTDHVLQLFCRDEHILVRRRTREITFKSEHIEIGKRTGKRRTGRAQIKSEHIEVGKRKGKRRTGRAQIEGPQLEARQR